MQNYDKEYPQHRQPENTGDGNQHGNPPPRSKPHHVSGRGEPFVFGSVEKLDFRGENLFIRDPRGLRHHIIIIPSFKNFILALFAFLCVFLFCFLIAKWKAETAPVKPKPDGQPTQNHNPEK